MNIDSGGNKLWQKINLEKFTEILEDEDFKIIEGMRENITIKIYTEGGVEMVGYLSTGDLVGEF